MKKQIKLLVFAVLLLCSVYDATAQDTLLVYDLSVVVTPIKNLPDSNGISAPATEAEVKIIFKVNNIPNLSQAFVKIGNSPDDSSFKSEVLNISNSNGVYKLIDSNNKAFKIWGQSAWYSFITPITNVSQIKHITLFVKDFSGIYSLKKYFKL